MRRIETVLLLLLLACALPLQAQIRGSEIQVNVVPDHQDWNYQVGETATFKISVTRSATLIDNVTIDYEAGPEMYRGREEERCGAERRYADIERQDEEARFLSC